MADVALQMLAVGLSQPDHFPYVLLAAPGEKRVLPIWLPNSTDRDDLLRVEGFTGEGRRTIDSLLNLCEKLGGVIRLKITNFHAGDIVVEAEVANGTRFEAAAVDLALLAAHFDVAVYVDEETFNSSAVFAADEDLREHFGVSFPTPAAQGESSEVDEDFARKSVQESTSASGNAQADAEFAEMMRSLGMTDEEMGDGGSPN